MTAVSATASDHARRREHEPQPREVAQEALALLAVEHRVLAHPEVGQPRLGDAADDEDDRRDGHEVAVVDDAEVADHQRHRDEAQQHPRDVGERADDAAADRLAAGGARVEDVPLCAEQISAASGRGRVGGHGASIGGARGDSIAPSPRPSPWRVV